MMPHPLEPQRCAKYLKAMADPDRLRIIQCLRDEPKSVGDIAGSLRLPVANTSHHLKMLRQAGLVAATKQGRFVVYALAPRFARRGRDTALDVLDFGCCRVELDR